MNELQPPRKPEPQECCGTGCIPCVMDIYEEELYEYEKALRQQTEPGAHQTMIASTVQATESGPPKSDPV